MEGTAGNIKCKWNNSNKNSTFTNNHRAKVSKTETGRKWCRLYQQEVLFAMQLRCRHSAARFLWLWIGIHWLLGCSTLCFLCCLGSCQWDELITLSEEFCWVWVCVCPIVCDLETSTMVWFVLLRHTHTHTCQKHDKKRDYILSACPMLAIERCIKWYDTVRSQRCLMV